MRLGVFGGTFDPPHIGHIEIARKVIEEGYVDKILFLPAALPPHKQHKTFSAFKDRFQMITLAAEKINDKYEVLDVEFARLPKPSYTIETMEELNNLYPNDQIILLIGGDSLMDLHTWFSAKTLIKKWEIITYPRSVGSVSLDILKKFWQPEIAKKLYNSNKNLPCIEVSSTEIRKKIQNDENVDHLLDKKVTEYIRKKKLYTEAK